MEAMARCISRSCTTGWLDWVHGELWLLPAVLLRRRLSWAESKQHGLGPTVVEPIARAAASEFELARLLAEHPTNKAVSFDTVARARLVRGITADGLRIVTHDGARHKLLWLPRDPAYDILAATLPTILGDRLAELPRSPRH
jgi:hypothetical protein